MSDTLTDVSYQCDGCGEWKEGEPSKEQTEHGGAVALLVCEDCCDRDRIRKPSPGCEP